MLNTVSDTAQVKQVRRVSPSVLVLLVLTVFPGQALCHPFCVSRPRSGQGVSAH